MSRETPRSWNRDAIYLVHIDHLTADRRDTYLTRTYGPYTSRTAARTQATRLSAHNWPHEAHRQARIEAAPVGPWTEVPT